jgi:Leucine-rich repeat (LRR) protein
MVQLDCSSNEGIQALPARLGADQPLLSAVVAEKCNISEFPHSLALATALRTLSLASNALTTIPEGALSGTRHLTACASHVVHS